MGWRPGEVGTLHPPTCLTLPSVFPSHLSPGSSQKVSRECTGLGGLGTLFGSQPVGGEGRCSALLGRLLGRGQCREAGEPTLPRRPPPLVFLFSLPTVSEKSSLHIRLAETQKVPSPAETRTGSPVPVSHPLPLPWLLTSPLLCPTPSRRGGC